MKVFVFDRRSQTVKEEKVPAEGLLIFLYKPHKVSLWLRSFLAKNFFISRVYGFWKKSFLTKRQVGKFIHHYNVVMEDFEDTHYKSFNHFFIRKLREGARKIAQSDLIAPADGRYLVYNTLKGISGIFAKGQTFSLLAFLGNDEKLAERYEMGSLMIARLAPVDYHRFHFPLNGTPKEAKLLNGALFSVNPIALRENIDYLMQNKRILVEMDTDLGKVAIVAIGATNVGSIAFTYTPGQAYKKGDELGYFSFGGSMLIILTEKQFQFDEDLVHKTKEGLETLCQMGDSAANRAV